MHLSVSSPRGGGGGVGGSGIGWGFWHFLKKIVKIPTPGEKELSKLAEKNGFLLFYSLKLKDKMHNVRSKSPPWGYTPQSKSRGLPDPPPPPPSGLTLIGALAEISLYSSTELISRRVALSYYTAVMPWRLSRRYVLGILGEQKRKRGEREAQVACERRSASLQGRVFVITLKAGPALVSLSAALSAVFSLVTQRSSFCGEERCVTRLKTTNLVPASASTPRPKYSIWRLSAQSWFTVHIEVWNSKCEFFPTDV